MALTVPTPPTPPTPPTIDKGDAAESHAKIDAHKFFNLPFERKSDLANEAFANGAETLIKRTVTFCKIRRRTSRATSVMALTVPTPPTPPTPPTIDKGDAAESHAKIDAHKFFNLPFERKEKPAVQAENPAPPVVEQKKSPAPEDLAREAVANGAGALTKKVVTRPADEEIPRQVQTAPPRDGKAVLREFQHEDFQPTVETPRNFSYSQRDSHGGTFWAVALILVGVISFVFAKKFLLKKNPAPKIDKPKVPAPKKPVKSKHFEIRV